MPSALIAASARMALCAAARSTVTSSWPATSPPSHAGHMRYNSALEQGSPATEHEGSSTGTTSKLSSCASSSWYPAGPLKMLVASPAMCLAPLWEDSRISIVWFDNSNDGAELTDSTSIAKTSVLDMSHPPRSRPPLSCNVRANDAVPHMYGANSKEITACRSALMYITFTFGLAADTEALPDALPDALTAFTRVSLPSIEAKIEALPCIKTTENFSS